MPARIFVDNLPQIRMALASIGAEAVKELGEVHKDLGRMWIGWLGGPDSGIGAGAGARYRPSANRREVLLRVGGSHRSNKVEQWGKNRKPESGRRPSIIGAATGREHEVIDVYQQKLNGIFRRHGM